MSELSEDVVARRLAAMAAETRDLLDSPEARTRMRERVWIARETAIVDMSDAAVDARIRRVAALRRLCLSLGAAEPIRGSTGPRDGR